MGRLGGTIAIETTSFKGIGNDLFATAKSGPMTFFLTCLFVLIYYLHPFQLAGVMGVRSVLIVGIMAFASLQVDALRGKLKTFRYPTDWFIIGLLFSIFLSWLANGWLGGAVDGAYKFLYVILGYFAIAHSIKSKKKAEQFIALLILVTVFLSLMAILQFYHPDAPPFGIESTMQRTQIAENEIIFTPRVKWIGHLADPNDFALALVVAIPFLLNRLAQKKYLLACVALPIVIFAIYLTNSRGGYLAAVASVFMFYVLLKGNWKGILFALVVAFAMMSLGPDRLAQLSGQEASAHGRIVAWADGLQMLKTHPLFGVGKDAFADFAGDGRVAHNSFVHVLGELGLFGTFFFVAFFYFPIWCYYRVLRSNDTRLSKEVRGILSAGMASLIGVMAAMFFLSRTYIFIPYLVVALLLGLLKVYIPEIQQLALKRKSMAGHIRNILIIEVVAIIFMQGLILTAR